MLLVVYFSYRQTISAYPHGGGSYTVAKENLGTTAGLFAAAALLLDYVLVVAVGISAGVGALVSAVPVLQPHTLSLCLLILAMITLVNLRGVRESGFAFMIPTYLFIVSLAGGSRDRSCQEPAGRGASGCPLSPPAPQPPAAMTASLWILMRAFASGCTAMTGVEAVSNGVTAFREPAVYHARRTLTAIIALLGVMLAGIAYLCSRVRNRRDRAGRDRVMRASCRNWSAAVIGRGFFYYLTIGSVLGGAGAVGQHRVCRFPAALPGDCAGWFSAQWICPPRAPARLFAGHPGAGGAFGRDPGRVWRDHRSFDSAVRRRGVPGFHAVAGRDGGALEAAWGASMRERRWQSTPPGRFAPA